MKKLIILIAFVATILVGCNNEKYPIEIEITTIAHGKLSPNIMFPKNEFIIKSQLEWNELITKMEESFLNLSNNKILSITNDFSKNYIIAVFEVPKTSGGWSIDITEVKEYKKDIIVTINNLQTGNVTTVYEQPFHFIKIPITNKRIVFEDNTQQYTLKHKLVGEWVEVYPCENCNIYVFSKNDTIYSYNINTNEDHKLYYHALNYKTIFVKRLWDVNPLIETSTHFVTFLPNDTMIIEKTRVIDNEASEYDYLKLLKK
ncbi:hypothetical protein LJC30_00905 [Odoribacter sp. OttesenSCG-928-L07]|nr:hypothetical protein [Odoribacter sp. OttesenSCG-928-L07]MDL2238976.1 hypothetical protein [Bacteroidales bacterium OttesenSCG-928-L14]MDL2240871.1 hypothetical protein [Bacteroidales bacterium OttesenSCG-928-K22]